MTAARLSLKARALKLLAQREHSRLELRRKLLPHARAACAAGESADPDDAGPCLDKLLDWLEEHRYLSEERLVESRVQVRAQHFGTRRIEQELTQLGVELDSAARRRLEASELERARAVWARKFAAEPADAAGRARQMRFLAGRGFAPEVIRRIVGGRDGG